MSIGSLHRHGDGLLMPWAMGRGRRSVRPSDGLARRPLVRVFGLSVAFLRERRQLALKYYASRKIGSWCRKEGLTVRRLDGPTIRSSTNCADVWVASRSFAVQNHCRPSYFRFAKNRKLVPERGLEPPTNCLRSNCSTN